VIRDCLIPALKREFSGWEITFDTPPHPVATFPAAQPAVGRVLVYDDGHEATIVIENVTHGHFNPGNENLTEDQRDETVTEEVIDFLKALFNDRVLLYSSPDKRRSGWIQFESDDGPAELSESLQYFLWSRPYET